MTKAQVQDPVHDIAVLIRSQYSLVFIESPEEERAEQVIIDATRECGHALHVWSITRGLVDASGKCSDPKTKEVSAALAAIEKGVPDSVYVMFDFGKHLEDEVVCRTLRDFTRLDRQTIVIVGPVANIPEPLRMYAAVYELPLPDTQAIHARVTTLVRQLTERQVLTNDLSEAEMKTFVLALRGLTIEQVDRVVSKLAHEDGRLTVDDLEAAVAAKAELLARDGVLELCAPRHGMDEVAGFVELKEWIRTRGLTFTIDAGSLGLDPPKGFMLTGVPGCGKSFIVKALAKEWNMPLLRLDAGALFDKYIGETERKLREALATAEALSPSILWIDEIEKGFATTGPSSSDGGLGYRLVGTLATWMQERKQMVFIAATSNNISILPPELTRKGRFDEIFFVDLPDAEEREQLFAIQLGMRDLAPDLVDCAELARITDGYSGSEIEQAVVSSLYSAHADQKPLDTGYVQRELEGTRPLSEVSPEKIAAIRDWGALHARTA